MCVQSVHLLHNNRSNTHYSTLLCTHTALLLVILGTERLRQPISHAEHLRYGEVRH